MAKWPCRKVALGHRPPAVPKRALQALILPPIEMVALAESAHWTLDASRALPWGLHLLASIS